MFVGLVAVLHSWCTEFCTIFLYGHFTPRMWFVFFTFAMTLNRVIQNVGYFVNNLLFIKYDVHFYVTVFVQMPNK